MGELSGNASEAIMALCTAVVWSQKQEIEEC